MKVGNDIFDILNGLGFRIKMFNEAGDISTDAEESTRFFSESPNILISIEPEDNIIKLARSGTHTVEEMEPIRKRIKELAGDSLMKFEYKIFNKNITPKDQAYQIKRETMEGINELRKLAGLEEAKPDFLDLDGDGDKKEPMKKAAKDKKKEGGDKKDAPKKGLSAKQKKLPAGLQKAIAKKKGAKTESVVTAKKEVAESMKFLDAIKIVKESNGEMKIEATDTAIWNWAKRVAQSKIGTGDVKEEAYAAKVYESRGGQWDVSRKVISE